MGNQQEQGGNRQTPQGQQRPQPQPNRQQQQEKGGMSQGGHMKPGDPKQNREQRR